LRPGQSYNIPPYTSAITNDGCKGTQIYNNCFDGSRNDDYRNQEGGQNTQIRDNIFTNTLPHTAISQRGTGFAIADLAASDYSIGNNCFYNNQNGNCYGCSSSNDDLQDPKTHNTGSGWRWTGTTWTYAEVPPQPLGSIQATQTRNTTDTDTHEFNSIFDNKSFANSANVTAKYGETRSSIMTSVSMNIQPNEIAAVQNVEDKTTPIWILLVAFFILGNPIRNVLARAGYNTYVDTFGTPNLSGEKYIGTIILLSLSYATPNLVLVIIQGCTIVSQFFMLNIMDYIEPSLSNA
jgi:hypothetical protein